MILSPKLFLWVLPLLYVIHCSKLSLYAISRKTNEPYLRKLKKPCFRPNFGLFSPNLDSKFFSMDFISLHATSRKTSEPNLRKYQRSQFQAQFWYKFGPRKIFMWVLPLLDVRYSCKLSLCKILRKNNEPILRKGQKTQFHPRFWLLWPKFGPPIFFLQILHLTDNKHYCKLSLHAISR